MSREVRLTLRAEIEITREKFHRLLVTVPEESLKLPSKDPGWTNGELLYSMCLAPMIIKTVLKQNANVKWRRPVFPKIVTGSLVQLTNEMFIRSRARHSTREAIAQEYDQTNHQILELLDGISEDGFDKQLVVYESVPLLHSQVTVEQLFHYVMKHFDVHRKQINSGN